MRVALFIPCYVDRCYPQVGRASLQLLRHFCPDDWQIDYPPEQTCCGQPMYNAGCEDAARPVVAHQIATFTGYDYVVCPSGSCTAMVKDHYPHLHPDREAAADLARRCWELCQFLVEVLHVDSLDVSFPHRVGIHYGCHGLRHMRMGASSERMDSRPDVVGSLLKLVQDIQLVELQRADECCGFGGTFSVTSEALSVAMGRDRIAQHVEAQAEVITSADMSCLMHMHGLIRRDGTPLRVHHVAEILAGVAS